MRFIISLLALLLTLPSYANKPAPIEVTPFAGYRFGGNFDIKGEFYGMSNQQELKVKIDDSSSYGVIIAWSYDNKRQGELLLSHYKSALSPASLLTPNTNDLSVTYLHIGGNVPLSNGLVPFWFSGGVGITHFSPDEQKLDDETKFSANIGVHSKFKLSNSIAIRLGARLYATFLDADSAMFCDDNSCKIAISSDIWTQSELSLGLTFTF